MPSLVNMLCPEQAMSTQGHSPTTNAGIGKPRCRKVSRRAKTRLPPAESPATTSWLGACPVVSSH
jgi:hypothetical protein